VSRSFTNFSAEFWSCKCPHSYFFTVCSVRPNSKIITLSKPSAFAIATQTGQIRNRKLSVNNHQSLMRWSMRMAPRKQRETTFSQLYARTALISSSTVSRFPRLATCRRPLRTNNHRGRMRVSSRSFWLRMRRGFSMSLIRIMGTGVMIKNHTLRRLSKVFRKM